MDDASTDDLQSRSASNVRLPSCKPSLLKEVAPMLAILSANIQGLCTSNSKHKLGVLKECAINDDAGIITLTESHLNEDYLESEIVIEGYTSFRIDRRRGTRKGGVITYLENKIAIGSTLVTGDSIGNIEYMMLKIPRLKLLYVAIYRPPTAELQH